VSDRTTNILKAAGIGALLVVAAAFVVSRIGRAGRSGEDGLTVWFYDESERELYAAPRDTIPPHEGVGGATGDGVRAVVVACPGAEQDAAKRKIAYLETYAPELKNLIERVRAARAAGRPCEESIPPRDSDFFQKNTLVRRADEPKWHDTTSAEALKIMSEWRGWRGGDGQPLVVCVP
jgi:hypothetical protein